MKNSGFKVPGQISDYKVMEMNINDPKVIGEYFDSKTMFSLFPKLKTSYVIDEALDMANDIYPNILGQKSELYTFFHQRIQRIDTKKALDVEVKVELPAQENYIEIYKVHVSAETTQVGRNENKWEMTVSTGNLSPRNIYQLLDHPNIYFKPLDNGHPDSTRGYKYTFTVHGRRGDYILTKRLKPGSRFMNIGAPRGEAALERGTVEMTVGGKAYVCYRYPFTKMGFQNFVTDEAWRLGTHFAYVKEEKDKQGYRIGFTFSELDGKFKMEAEKVYDRYLVSGQGFPVGEGFTVDKATHRPYTLGPTWMDFFRAANKEFYYVDNFNIEYILDRIRRQVTKMKISDRSGLMVDVLTGDGGWDLLNPELDRLNTAGVIDPEWLYSKHPGLDKNRQGVILNKMQVRGIHLDDYGTVVFHNNDILNNGLLSGQRNVRKGFKLSSYWFIIMISHNNDRQQPMNKAMQLFENSAMEQFTPLVGSFTPSGPIAKTSNTYPSAGDIGNQYKTIYDMEKAIYVPNIASMHVLYSNLVIND